MEIHFHNNRKVSTQSVWSRPTQSSGSESVSSANYTYIQIYNLFLGSCHTLPNICFIFLLTVGFQGVCSRSQTLQSQSSTATTAMPSDDGTIYLEPYLLKIAITTLLISHFLNLEGSLFLLGWKRDLVRHLEYKLLSVSSLCTACATFIIFLLCDHVQIVSVLVGVAVILSLTQTTFACILCGPSHELRDIMMWSLRTLAVLQAVFTVASVFMYQAFECSDCRLLQYVLIGFILWSLIFCGICVVFTNIDWTFHRSRKGVSPPSCFSRIVNKYFWVPITFHFLISLAVITAHWVDFGVEN